MIAQPPPSCDLATAISSSWSWTARPARTAYQLEHECGLTFDVDAHQAETMSAEDAGVMARAMAGAVEFRVG